MLSESASVPTTRREQDALKHTIAPRSSEAKFALTVPFPPKHGVFAAGLPRKTLRFRSRCSRPGSRCLSCRMSGQFGAVKNLTETFDFGCPLDRQFNCRSPGQTKTRKTRGAARAGQEFVFAG